MTPREQRLSELAQEIEDRLHEAESLLKGLAVVRLHGQHKGRVATISQVGYLESNPRHPQPDRRKPSFMVLARVTRVDGQGYLNDPESRQYKTLYELVGWR